MMLVTMTRTCFSLNGEDIRLMLWDTAGQEEFDCITRAYYRSVSSHIVNGDLWPLKYTGLV